MKKGRKVFIIIIAILAIVTIASITIINLMTPTLKAVVVKVYDNSMIVEGDNVRINQCWIQKRYWI